MINYEIQITKCYQNIRYLSWSFKAMCCQLYPAAALWVGLKHEESNLIVPSDRTNRRICYCSQQCCCSWPVLPDRQVQLWVQWPHSGCCTWITEILVRKMKSMKEEQLPSMNQDFWIDSIWQFHSPLPTEVWCKNKVNMRKNTAECFCGSLQRKHTD